MEENGIRFYQQYPNIWYILVLKNDLYDANSDFELWFFSVQVDPM